MIHEGTNKLAAVNTSISEEDQVVKLLGSLPGSYSTLVTVLETRFVDLTLNYVQQALMSEEQRRKEQSDVTTSSNTDAALTTSGNYTHRSGTQENLLQVWFC